MEAGVCKWLILSILLAAQGYSPNLAQGNPAKDPIEEEIEGFHLKNQTALDALAYFDGATPFSVSVELPLKEKWSAPNAPFPRFEAYVQGGKARDVLNRICALDPRFTWSRYKNTINVYPKAVMDSAEKYFLNRRLARVQLEQVYDPAQAVFQTVALLPGPPEQVAFMQAGGPPGFATPLRLDLRDVTVREVLDEVAEHFGEGYGWTLSGALNFRLVQFHARLRSEEPS